MSTDIIVIDEVREFPPIPEEHNTPTIRRRTAQFYRSVAGMFEAWVEANENPHTQRAYRQGVMLFIQFMGIRWPEEDYRLVRDVAVSDVRAWRDQMLKSGTAPSTRNHRISALSRLYEYLQAQAANFRIPILIANPAHKHYIKRKRAAPRRQAQAFALNLLHQLFAMPEGDGVLAWRDRALFYYMYGAGAREETACRAQVSDVDFDAEEGPKLLLRVKGDKTGWIGLHVKAYEMIRTYIEVAGLTSGPLFPTQLNPKSQKLGTKAFTTSGLTKHLNRYIERLPGAFVEEEVQGVKKRVRRYSSHSFRSTAATLALKQGEDMRKVQKFLFHEQITTTQVYDRREFSFKESVSHVLPM